MRANDAHAALVRLRDEFRARRDGAFAIGEEKRAVQWEEAAQEIDAELRSLRDRGREREEGEG